MERANRESRTARGRAGGGDGRLARRAGGAVLWRGAQLLGVNGLLLIRLVVLARLLAPDDFGLLAIAVTVIGMGLKLTDFGIAPALVQHPELSDRHYDTGWTAGLVRATAVALAVAATAPFLAALFAEPRATDVVRVLAVRPVVDALASIKTAQLTRDLKARPLALWHVSGAAANTVASIALAPALGVWALVIGALAGAATSVAVSYVVAPHRPRLAVDRDAAASLLAFGRWVFATTLLVTATALILRVAIARELDAAALGVYFLAARLAFLPSEIAAGVVGSVAFPVFVQLRAAPAALRSAFQSLWSGLGAILLPMSAVLVALAPGLTEHLLGPRWTGAAPVIRILAIVSAIGFLGDVAVPLFQGLGRPKLVTVLETVQFLAVGGLVTVLIRSLGLPGAAVAWLVASIASLVVCVRLLRGVLDRPFGDLARSAGALVSSAVVGGGAAVGVSAAAPGAAGVIAAALAGMASSAWLLWVADRRLGLGLVADLVRVFPQLGALRLGTSSRGRGAAAGGER